MKRIIPIILILALLFTACGENNEQPENSVADFSAEELAEAVITDLGRSLDSVEYINENYEAEAIPVYVKGFYGLDAESWEQCAIFRAAAADDAFEISIFKLTDLADINTVFNELEEYRHGRQGDFFGYNPKQADIVDASIISISSDGKWAAVLICEDSHLADEAFFAALDMELPKDYYEQVETPDPDHESVYIENIGELPEYWLTYVDPEIDDMTLWDNSAVVEALRNRDASALDEVGQKLYKEANKVLNNQISEEMSAIEKEKAIYDWLSANCEYDHRHYNVPNNAPRYSYEPYGAIVEGEAVCLGFATAFQLFMDVLDIECITVVGGAFQSREDHAWNMVKIDGEWYCVDPTWDAGCNPEWYSYFNVSSEFMALTDHQWDYENYPLSQPVKIGTGMQ